MQCASWLTNISHDSVTCAITSSFIHTLDRATHIKCPACAMCGMTPIFVPIISDITHSFTHTLVGATHIKRSAYAICVITHLQMPSWRSHTRHYSFILLPKQRTYNALHVYNMHHDPYICPNNIWHYSLIYSYSRQSNAQKTPCMCNMRHDSFICLTHIHATLLTHVCILSSE